MADGGAADGLWAPLLLAVVGLAGVGFSWLRGRQKARAAQGAPAIRLLAPKEPQPPLGFFVEASKWGQIPGWIKQDRGLFGRHPQLAEDPLFRDLGDPCLLPFLPTGQTTGVGAAVICPGGNYEFFTADEGLPVARWVVETLGIPAYVLKSRLLPDFGLPEMVEDFGSAVRMVRQRCGPGPVVAIGFSAGAHLSAAACAATGKEDASPPERPDAQVLVYPSLDASEWQVEKTAEFFRAKVTSRQVKSLNEGPGGRQQLLVAGADFVKPPPTFMVGSTEDWVCWVSKHSDPYVKAARMAKADIQYMRGPYGNHGFGLKEFWTTPCQKWLRGKGFGAPTTADKKAA